jgi:exodeoxyribonuclease V gamma subunit
MQQLEGPYPIAGWVERIRTGLLSLTDAATEREAAQRARCFEVLEHLQSDAADSEAPVGRLALLDLLRREFAAMDSGAGFVSGMVTVAELRPMRSLPASVIAVAGLDAESFPRRDPQDGLDLAARHRRRGDRSPRDDDRQLFLELLLCARERLILSFVGRGQQDDRKRTLSPCVQELLDTVERLGTAKRTLEHSLQPFAGPAARFLDESFPEPESAGGERIALTDLREFWKNPSRWFCRRVLNLALSRDRDEAESEALRLDGLQKWRLRDLALRGAAPELNSAHTRARLGLPTHDLMTLEFDAIQTQIERVVRKIGFPLEQIIDEPVEVVGDGFIVSGDLKRQENGPLIEMVSSSLVSPKHRVPALISHVVANCAGASSNCWFGPVGTPDKIKLWKPVEDPESVLATLVEGYRIGQRTPLRFFPRTSLAFAKAMAIQDDAAAARVFALGDVQKEWATPPEDARYGRPGERFEEVVALCVRGLSAEEVCDEEFVRWSSVIAGWLSQVERKS